MRPAELALPSTTKTILLVDRTKTEPKATNIIESVFTGELPGEDKAGAQELLVALYRQLDRSSRFNTIIAEEHLEGNSLNSVFPEQLSTEIMNRLAVKYNADAIVAVELFDSDFAITRGKKENEKSGTLTGIQYYAQGIGNVTIGIRLYDIHQKKVLDQQLLTNGSTWEATGASVPEAVAQLTSKGDATMGLSRQVGEDYAYKISPMPISIRRSFRGKARRVPELELGTRYADVGQWERALETWKSALDRAPEKEAGYLAHNIAIAYEVMGDFDSAIYWAKLAYTRYGNEESRSYVNQIKQRLSSEGLAQMQQQ
jgi:tetratricopeptide (TPR) repeat protein